MQSLPGAVGPVALEVGDGRDADPVEMTELLVSVACVRNSGVRMLARGGGRDYALESVSRDSHMAILATVE